MSTFEVSIDNERVQVHCNDAPAVETWTYFDLADAVFFSSGEDGIPEGQYNSGTGYIESYHNGSGFDWRRAQFHFPGFVLDPTKTYEFKATYLESTFGMGVYQQNPAWESTFWSDNDTLISTFAELTEYIESCGPGINDWDQAISDDYQTLIRFDMSTNGSTGTNSAPLVSLGYREV